MNDFIKTDDWPFVCLTMPEQVADKDVERHMHELAALFERAAPFVLIMVGAELPRHSPRFMKAYGAWSRSTFTLQRLYCRGAVRIETDPVQRETYKARARQAENMNPPPYPYAIAASENEARKIAEQWLKAEGAVYLDRVGT